MSPCSKNRLLKCLWFFIVLGTLSSVTHISAIGQTYVGLSLNIGNRQYYKPSEGFKSGLAPSGSISISRNNKVNDNWFFRYGAAAGVLGYKLKVIMIDTLGPNGDVSPFPEYSTFFASAEVLFGHRLSVSRRSLLIGVGWGITTYASSAPTSLYGVQVVTPNNDLISLFEARMTHSASHYSLLWKAAAYYDINKVLSVGMEYIYHKDPASKGTYVFHHTRTPHSGVIKIYQREFRFGIFYKLGKFL